MRDDIQLNIYKLEPNSVQYEDLTFRPGEV